jgi:hypothetical protein
MNVWNGPWYLPRLSPWIFITDTEQPLLMGVSSICSRYGNWTKRNVSTLRCACNYLTEASSITFEKNFILPIVWETTYRWPVNLRLQNLFIKFSYTQLFPTCSFICCSPTPAVICSQYFDVSLRIPTEIEFRLLQFRIMQAISHKSNMF